MASPDPDASKRLWAETARDPKALEEALENLGPDGFKKLKSESVLWTFVRDLARKAGLTELIKPTGKGKEG